MGEVLIGEMSALLISIFLGPQFIRYLKRREFGQHIRDEGPIEHHAKAGTPTMGGVPPPPPPRPKPPNPPSAPAAPAPGAGACDSREIQFNDSPLTLV